MTDTRIEIPCVTCRWRVVQFQSGLRVYRCRKRDNKLVAMYLIPSWDALVCLPEEDCYEPLECMKPWERDWCRSRNKTKEEV